MRLLGRPHGVARMPRKKMRAGGTRRNAEARTEPGLLPSRGSSTEASDGRTLPVATAICELLGQPGNCQSLARHLEVPWGNQYSRSLEGEP